MAVLLASACSGARSNLPTHAAANSGPSGIQSGLLVDDRFCIYLSERDTGHRWLVVWPERYSRSGDVILNGEHLEARVGDTITLGGGQIDHGDYAFLRTKLATDVPERCRDSDYWITDGPVR